MADLVFVDYLYLIFMAPIKDTLVQMLELKTPGGFIAVVQGIGSHWGSSEVRNLFLVPDTIQVV